MLCFSYSNSNTNTNTYSNTYTDSYAGRFAVTNTDAGTDPDSYNTGCCLRSLGRSSDHSEFRQPDHTADDSAGCRRFPVAKPYASDTVKRCYDVAQRCRGGA